MFRIHQVALAALMVAALATPSRAQDVTQAEIQRLQDNIYQASTDVSQLRNRDVSRASQLQSELDDLRDEVTYLKVKLRKERSLSRAEYTDVRVRIEPSRRQAFHQRGSIERFSDDVELEVHRRVEAQRTAAYRARVVDFDARIQSELRQPSLRVGVDHRVFLQGVAGKQASHRGR